MPPEAESTGRQEQLFHLFASCLWASPAKTPFRMFQPFLLPSRRGIPGTQTDLQGKRWAVSGTGGRLPEDKASRPPDCVSLCVCPLGEGGRTAGWLPGDRSQTCLGLFHLSFTLWTQGGSRDPSLESCRAHGAEDCLPSTLLA